MALHVRKLNGDATFLLTFTPSFAPSSRKNNFPGSYTILIDPWLHGDSHIFHETFATSRHTTPPAIKTLAELQDRVDLIIVSQDKSDHLSRETICSLPRNSTTKILTTPKAAKKIRSWRHFDNPNIVQEIPPYNPKRDETVVRIRIEPYSSASAEGEITVTNILQKMDLADLHNAIGITYCPPGSVFTAPDGSEVKLTDMPMMARSDSTSPPSSPRSPRHRDIRSSLDKAPTVKKPNQKQIDQVELGSPYSIKPLTRPRVDSPIERPSTSGSRKPDISTVAKRLENYEKVLSVIYTPHGTELESLQSCVRHHLSPLHGALPVTALFHSMNWEANPWWFGGVVCAGAPGGIRIAREIGVKYWVSAHDEAKEMEGWGTTMLKSRQYGPQEVVKMMREADGIGGGRGVGTQVCVMGSGQERRLIG